VLRLAAPGRWRATWELAAWLRRHRRHFDVVHAHQALHHVTDPVQALREMARVSRRLVAVRDMDWGGFSWWPRHPEVDAWYAGTREREHAHGGDLDAGRKLLAWAREAGFTDVTASSSTWCFASAEDRSAWADRQHHDAQRWDAFVADDGAWLSVLHGEILVRVT
jgi:SAM-dependent methyltransferase